MAGIPGRFYASLKSIYRPRYIVLNIAIALVYYEVLISLVKLQNKGILLFNVSLPLIYLLVASSSVLLSIAIYSIKNTRRNQAKVSATGIGAATTLMGGVIGGCGCSAPLIFGLTSIGISASELTPTYLFLADNTTPLFLAMAAINIVAIAYYLNKLSTPSCRINASRKGVAKRS